MKLGGYKHEDEYNKDTERYIAFTWILTTNYTRMKDVDTFVGRYSLDVHSAVGPNLGLETGHLSWSELGHAGIVRIVHVIVCQGQYGHFTSGLEGID